MARLPVVIDLSLITTVISYSYKVFYRNSPHCKKFAPLFYLIFASMAGPPVTPVRSYSNKDFIRTVHVIKNLLHFFISFLNFIGPPVTYKRHI
jgi:hypothetical protein